jgi:hypothetical protein
MKQNDIVYLMVGAMPAVGQVVGFTNKRVRIAVSNGIGYTSVLRAKHNCKLAKRARKLI